METRERLKGFIALFAGSFVVALVYNLLILPNNFVTGGVSDIATVLNAKLGWNSGYTIMVANLVLIILCYFMLGKESAINNLLGSILYPIFVTLSVPLAKFLMPYFQFNSIVITLIVAIVLHGAALGFVYKYGYSTGGSDIISQIVSKYFHTSLGSAVVIVSIFFFTIGSLNLGFSKIIYALIINFGYSFLIDKIVIGISDAKMFMIYTGKIAKVHDFIINKMGIGATIFETTGGYSNKNREMIMCVVNTRDYYKFKTAILDIDAGAFFVVSDCYEVSGGVNRKQMEFKKA